MNYELFRTFAAAFFQKARLSVRQVAAVGHDDQPLLPREVGVGRCFLRWGQTSRATPVLEEGQQHPRSAHMTMLALFEDQYWNRLFTPRRTRLRRARRGVQFSSTPFRGRAGLRPAYLVPCSLVCCPAMWGERRIAELL